MLSPHEATSLIHSGLCSHFSLSWKPSWTIHPIHHSISCFMFYSQDFLQQTHYTSVCSALFPHHDSSWIKSVWLSLASAMDNFFSWGGARPTSLRSQPLEKLCFLFVLGAGRNRISQCGISSSTKCAELCDEQLFLLFLS